MFARALDAFELFSSLAWGSRFHLTKSSYSVASLIFLYVPWLHATRLRAFQMFPLKKISGKIYSESMKRTLHFEVIPAVLRMMRPGTIGRYPSWSQSGKCPIQASGKEMPFLKFSFLIRKRQGGIMIHMLDRLTGTQMHFMFPTWESTAFTWIAFQVEWDVAIVRLWQQKGWKRRNPKQENCVVLVLSMQCFLP